MAPTARQPSAAAAARLVLSSGGQEAITDEGLAAAARGGDARALDSLLRRYESRVLRMLRLLGVPGADREDVAQEVFVRVFRHLGGYRSGQAFSGWVYRITVNASHDYRSRAGRHRAREVDWEPSLDQRRDLAPGPAEVAAGQESKDRLERALEGLTDRERSVFVLCEVEGLDSREVSRALGISAVTVRRHLGRARARLRELLDVAGGVED